MQCASIFAMSILGRKELKFPKRIATVFTRFESADSFESAKGARLGVYRTPPFTSISPF
jgi:hypothetical protein